MCPCCSARHGPGLLIRCLPFPPSSVSAGCPVPVKESVMADLVSTTNTGIPVRRGRQQHAALLHA
ncbi:exported hypothetical protein [Streptomyces misionensis JCM 4497]